ncbi:MAG: DUF1697 domain-containing protein [Notoacmeibacter sp.]|nr:DUF1697 domain-containing protein [Notoacmeibacter sp.]MCC0032248.1 DUF1697 domain-containing protein [Brucellaceae bacterium]
MTMCLALLRAVNVGGTGKVPMADLAAMFTELGLAKPKTYLATGNVVFVAGCHDPEDLETQLAERAQTHFGLKTTFFLRDAAEWDAMLAANPFPDFAEGFPSRLLVYSLKSQPDGLAENRMAEALKGRESVRLIGRHLYATYPDGIADSKLTLAVIEKALSVAATGRNWNTANKLASLLASHGRR